jgi:hypothetical protein
MTQKPLARGGFETLVFLEETVDRSIYGSAGDPTMAAVSSFKDRIHWTLRSVETYDLYRWTLASCRRQHPCVGSSGGK